MFDDLFYNNALPRAFNVEGYVTSVFFSSADLGTLGEIYREKLKQIFKILDQKGIKMEGE